MSFIQLFKSVHHFANSLLPTSTRSQLLVNNVNRMIHSICNKRGLPSVPSTYQENSKALDILRIAPTMYNLVRGMKVRNSLNLRCKHCYKVARHERLYVMCKKHPRHKQMSMKPKPYKTWILTSVSQTPKRPW